jgi:hypothetical protein
LASDRVLPVHFRLLSLVLFIRGASFVCPALAFELRVLDLAFLVPRPPATPLALHNQYTATVRTEGFRCQVVLQSFSATLFQVISLQEQGIKQTQTHPIDLQQGEAIDRPSTISPISRIRILPSTGINDSILSTAPSARYSRALSSLARSG